MVKKTIKRRSLCEKRYRQNRIRLYVSFVSLIFLLIAVLYNYYTFVLPASAQVGNPPKFQKTLQCPGPGPCVLAAGTTVVDPWQDINGDVHVSGRLGIGTTNPQHKVDVAGDISAVYNSPGNAIYGQSTNGVGVRGDSFYSTGVYGLSNAGVGVYGISFATYGGYFYGYPAVYGLGDIVTSSKFCIGASCISSWPSMSETDPKVGAVTAGKWCQGDGSAVQCNYNSPGGRLVITLSSNEGPSWTSNTGWASDDQTEYYWENSGLPSPYHTYFEVYGKAWGCCDTFAVGLQDATTGLLVGTVGNWSNDSQGRIRSGDLGMLINGHTYKVFVYHSGGGNSFSVQEARIIIAP